MTPKQNKMTPRLVYAPTCSKCGKLLWTPPCGPEHTKQYSEMRAKVNKK